MDRLASMQVFVHVAERGSFAAAARALDLSPAMVAKHIQAIEARLKAPLLHRTTRRQSLTDVGRLYLDRCREALSTFAQAEATGEELLAHPHGVLRVTAPVVLGTHGLAPLLAGFMQQFPDVQVELSLNDRVVDLVDEGFDVALRSGAVGAGERLVARPLRPLRMLLCASPDYLSRHGTPRRPDDLQRHVCLAFAHWVHKDRWRLVGPQGEVGVPVKSPLVINNGDALRQAALGGAGILMQSELLLAEDLRAGRLVRVLPRHAPPARAAQVVYLPERRHVAKVRCFVDHVLEHLG
ncbi:MAG: LysR family transcriptional regulator [Rubrivivax sp.]|nr:MAG: LysR family transcriptional regulator [Rubrivivax sp.]